MNKVSYYVTKDKDKKSLVCYEVEDEGYEVKPKVQKKGTAKVGKIVFINDDLSERVIRKKINNKIDLLLKMLKDIDDDSSDGDIQRGLMDAEKLRIQIINKYIKYLGNTYESLTLKKIEIIIDEFRYKLYTKKEKEFLNMYVRNEGRSR